MEKVLYEEVQTVRRNGWLWFAYIVSLLGATIPVLDGIYWQMALRQPWANGEFSDLGLIALLLFETGIAIMVAYLINVSRLEVRIGTRGIQYRTFPTQTTWQAVVPEEIDAYEIRQRESYEGGIWKHLDGLKKTKDHKFLNTRHLLLKMKNGDRIMLGTSNPDGMAWGMKRLMAGYENR